MSFLPLPSVDDLKEQVKQSLINNRFGCIPFLLQILGNEFELEKDLLDTLYRSADMTYLEHLLKGYSIKMDEGSGEHVQKNVVELMAKLFSDEFAQTMFEEEGMSKRFEHLFIWLVLTGQDDMAEYFWKFCESPLCLALIACRIFREMSKCLGEADSGAFLEKAAKFENLAVRLVLESSQRNKVSRSTVCLILVSLISTVLNE